MELALEGTVLKARVRVTNTGKVPGKDVALLFAACNVALWIAWSGDWVDDLFVGAAFAVAAGDTAAECVTLGVADNKQVCTMSEFHYCHLRLYIIFFHIL